MERFQLTAGRSLRLAVFLFVVLALAAVWFYKGKSEPPESDTDARIAFYSARAAGRGTYPAYARLGAAYLQKARETGDAKLYALAEENLKKSQEFQINFEAIRSLAALSLDLHRFGEALAFAQQAVNTMAGDLESRGLLFDAQLALGKTQDAEVTLRRMQAAAANSFGVLTRQANLQELRGDLMGALASIEQACAPEQISKLSRQSQAWCQVRMGSLKLLANCDAAGAEVAHRRALQIFPNYFLAREHLAELLASTGRLEGIQLYQRLIVDAPNPRYHLALADLLEMQGDTPSGLAQRQQALALLWQLQREGARGYLLDLAYFLVDDPVAQTGRDATANLKEGLRIAEQEIAIRHDLFALDALAWAQFRNGQTQEALSNIEETLSHGTKRASVLLHAAEILLAAGQKDRAVKLFGEATRCPMALLTSERAAAQHLQTHLPN